jgi:hypothetical protein
MGLFQEHEDRAGNKAEGDGVKALIDDRWYRIESESE